MAGTGMLGEPFIFVTFAEADEAWAGWLSWQLETAGYKIKTRLWDLVPGTSKVNWLDREAAGAQRILVVISPTYHGDDRAGEEWQSSQGGATGEDARTVVPVIVEACQLRGMLASFEAIDLVGLGETEALARLLDGMRAVEKGSRRPDPGNPPPFPGQPGPASPGADRSASLGLGPGTVSAAGQVTRPDDGRLPPGGGDVSGNGAVAARRRHRVFAAMFLVLVVTLSAVLITDRASEQSARTSPLTPDRFCSQSEKIGVDSESVIYVEGCGRIEGNAIVDMLVAVHSNTPTPPNYTDCAVSWAYRYNANLPVRSHARDCMRIGNSAEVQFLVNVSGTATEFWGHVGVRFNNVLHYSEFRLLI